jgi:hypothetical protein
MQKTEVGVSTHNMLRQFPDSYTKDFDPYSINDGAENAKKNWILTKVIRESNWGLEGADTGRRKEGVTSLVFVVFGLRPEEQMSLMHRSSQQDACNWRSGIWADQSVDLIGNRLHQQELFVVFFSASRQLLYTWVYCCILFYFINTKLY